MAEENRKAHFMMSLRLRPSMGTLLESLSRQMSIPKTNVIALALQELAERRGVPIPTDEEETATA